MTRSMTRSMTMQADIREVTVFHQGARVVRELILEAAGGQLPTTVEIPRLPLALLDPTVKVRVEAVEGDGQVFSSQVRVGLYAPSAEEVPPPPDEAELKEAKRTIVRVERQLALLQHEVDLLGGLHVPPRPRPEEGKPPPASPMTARVALEAFAHEATDKRIKERRQLKAELREARLRLAHLEEQRARRSNALAVEPGELTKVVVCSLEQRGAVGKARLAVEYFVPGARWVPAYQCRLEPAADRAEVHLRAMVCQRTGEDWRGVRLKLSTAAPLRFTELPELSAIRIGKAQPPSPQRPGFRPPPRGAQSLFSDFDRDGHATRGLLPAGASWQPPSTSLRPLAALSLGRPQPRMKMAPPPVPASAPPPPAPAGGFGGRAPAMRAAFDDDSDALLELDGAGDELTPPAGASLALDDASDVASSELTMEVRSLAKAKRAPRPGKGGASGRELAVEAVLFAHLRLADGDDAHRRGRLSPVNTAETYRETLARSGRAIHLDLAQVAQAAERRAAAALDTVLPEGCADVRRSSGSFDFVYEADSVVDVPSDLAFHSIPVGGREAEADVRYVVVPREDTSVFRVATLKNPIAAPLLPGPAEVYVGGEYVLTTQLPTVPPRGDFKLGLGVEQAIKCARNTRFREERSGDTRVGMNELKHFIEIELRNNLPRPVRCEVRERIPAPAPAAEVEVIEQGVEPGWERWTQEEQGRVLEGGRRWSLELPAHDKTTVKASYIVRIYANNELVGGNRREV